MRAAVRRPASNKRGSIRREVELTGLVILTIFFLAGGVFGAFTGDSAAADNINFDGGVYDSGFWYLLFSASKYHLMIVAAAGSLFGVLLIPAVLAARGFALSCTAIALASAFPDNAALIILIILGLPALFAVPGLFILGCEGFRFTGRLLMVYRRRTPAPDYHDPTAPVCLTLATLIAAAAVEAFAVPALMGLLMK